MENYLSIQNFKCFTDVHIPLRNLTVLAGGNSGGKSTVIQSLLLLRSAIEKSRLGADKILLNENYLLNLGNSFDVISRNASSNIITLLLRNHRNKAKLGFFKIDLKDPQIFLEIDKIKSKLGKEITEAVSPIIETNFHYLNAERLGPRSYYPIADRDKNVGWQGEYTISLLSSSAVETQEYDVPASKMFPGSKNPRLRAQAEAWMGEIVPDLSINPQKISEINQAYVKYGNASPQNVGFGISYVLPIVVSGLIAGKNEMFIVENPEAHLHPSGQSRIGRFLARVAASGTQVIVETHSEHVINGIRLAALEKSIKHEDVAINFFQRQATGNTNQPEVRTILLNENADLDYWPKGFFDQQQEDIARIFKIRKHNKL